MAKEKIYALKLKESAAVGLFYNFHDTNSYDLTTLEWMGGKWLDNSRAAIIEFHKENLKDFEPMAKEEFDDFIKKLKANGDEFADYLEECELANNTPIEEL